MGDKMHWSRESVACSGETSDSKKAKNGKYSYRTKQSGHFRELTGMANVQP